MAPTSSYRTDALEMFGIEILHSHTAANELPPQQNAAESLIAYGQAGDKEAVDVIQGAVKEVSMVVGITRKHNDELEGLAELFTADQIIDMQAGIHSYLGMSLPDHLKRKDRRPEGYQHYIGRLGMYFMLSDDSVTTSFGAFERHHLDGDNPHATGPLEENSRDYAMSANAILVRQFKEFYQADFEVELTGPAKHAQDGRWVWRRGIAECQFIVLDHIRDQLIKTGTKPAAQETPTMTPEDIETNLLNLLANQRTLVDELRGINVLLAGEVKHALSNLAPLTVERMHRGRLGIPEFKKNPEAARRAIANVERLLIQAAALSQAQSHQTEIPILDL